MYVTPAQLAIGSDSLNELSELLQVQPALLQATIDGTDRSAWEVDEIARADDALTAIQHNCDQAAGEVDSRLARRGYALPFDDPGQFPVLSVWARAIARYHLHPQRDRTSEETGRIERDYRQAIRSLDLVAKGELTLGAGDPLAGQANDPQGGAIRVEGGQRIFNRQTLGGL